MLATADDVAVRMGRTLSGSEEDRLEALIADASASIIAYTGQQFTLTETTARVRTRNGRIRLPQRPVASVTSVVDTNDVAVPFSWYAGDSIDLTLSPINAFEIEPRRTALQWVEVTYEHGYDSVPDDVVAVVCQVAARALGRPAEESGIQQESIAGYSYSVGTAAASGGLGLLPDEKAVLDRYRIPISMGTVAL